MAKELLLQVTPEIAANEILLKSTKQIKVASGAIQQVVVLKAPLMLNNEAAHENAQHRQLSCHGRR
jgi:hypothetical protein